MSERTASGVSRRDLLKQAAAGAAAIAGSGIVARPVFAGAPAQNAGPADLAFVNGKFVDGRGQVATGLTIRNGRITSLGNPSLQASNARTIDLGRRH